MRGQCSRRFLWGPEPAAASAPPVRSVSSTLPSASATTLYPPGCWGRVFDTAAEQAFVPCQPIKAGSTDRLGGRRAARGDAAGAPGGYLADFSSDLKSATGPRWASLSGLTMALM